MYGTSGKLERELGEIQRAANIARELPMNEDDRKRFIAVIEELEGYIGRLAAQMKKVEAVLEKEGCRINHKNGRVSFNGLPKPTASPFSL